MASLDVVQALSISCKVIRQFGDLLKESKSGMPSASAQCTWANAGGLEIIASAANVLPDASSGS